MATKPVKKKGCCPYQFDGSICRAINDRIQCGYDKNSEGPKEDDIEKDLSGGCRLRFGRVECGYWDPPYVNLRRPQAWDDTVQKIVPLGYVERHSEEVNVKSTTKPLSNINLVTKFGNNLKTLENSKESSRRKQKPKINFVKLLQRKRQNRINCVEIDDRIVCKPF